MHNLFLGEFKHHCMQVFGIDTVGEKTTSKGAVVHTPTQQKAQLDRIFSAIVACAESALVKIRRDYLAAVAEFNNVAAPGAKLTKSEYATALVKWYHSIGCDAERVRLPPTMEDSTAYFRLPSSDDVPKEFQKYCNVFTGEVLQEVRKDITKTSLPSWLETPPRNFGSPSHGKLKADHWRTIGTVSLVMTLVRLWGTAGASIEEREVLDNFISLAVAVDLATRRSMDRPRAALYDQYMQRYLQSLRSLFNHSLVPNHHLSLHLPQCLDLFGPVHGWWAFPFERYNGVLQRLNTNNKPGDMPLTFMRYFYKAGMLRSLLSTLEWPDVEVYTDMAKSIDAAIGDALRGTRVMDVLTSSVRQTPLLYDEAKQVPLPDGIYDALLRLINLTVTRPFQSIRGRSARGTPRLPPDAQFIQRLGKEGVTFATQGSSNRNSFILFRDSQTRHGKAILAGQISDIFYHCRVEGDATEVEAFLIVKEYLPLSEAHQSLDPYRRFPDLQTKLYYNSFKQELCLIRANDIVAHFASMTYIPENIGQECIVVRSLDRVSGPMAGVDNSKAQHYSITRRRTCLPDIHQPIVRNSAV
ncbi:hypothetical protein C8Q79DRAFT_901952 [Trametes meyenii]|nr:hypothetical protein C8Q79DRAFT_901952 [Trametes meyenii]